LQDYAGFEKIVFGKPLTKLNIPEIFDKNVELLQLF